MTVKPESFEQLLASVTPDIHQQLRTAIELGRWPNGERLTAEQKENSLQLVIDWKALHLPEEERVGYIDRTNLRKSQCDD